MNTTRAGVYLSAAGIVGTLTLLIWLYGPSASRSVTTGGPQSQKEIEQIRMCLSRVPGYAALYLGDQVSGPIFPVQMALGPFVALSSLNEGFYTGAVTTSLGSTTETTDLWIGKMSANEGTVGSIVVSEDDGDYECVSFKPADIGAAIDQFSTGDVMIWDAEGEAYFKLNGETVSPIGAAAQELLPSTASLSDLQNAVLQRTAHSLP